MAQSELLRWVQMLLISFSAVYSKLRQLIFFLHILLLMVEIRIGIFQDITIIRFDDFAGSDWAQTQDLAGSKHACLQTLYHELRRKVLAFVMKNVQTVPDSYTEGPEITWIWGFGKNHLMNLFCKCDCRILLCK